MPYLLELLNGTLVDTTALVDQMACMYCESCCCIIARGRVSRLTSGGGLAGIDMADNDDVDMSLLLTAERRQVSDEVKEAWIALRRWMDMV